MSRAGQHRQPSGSIHLAAIASHGAPRTVPGACVLLALIICSGAGYARPEGIRSDIFHKVPFVFLSTQEHQVEWLLRPGDLQSKLLVNTQPCVLPPGWVPMKTFALSPGTLLVLGRYMFSDLLSFVRVNGSDGSVQTRSFPAEMERHVFRNAIQHEKNIYIVLFDPLADAHFLRRWSMDASLSPVVDAGFHVPLAAPATSFHLDFKCLIEKTETSLWIGGKNLAVEIPFSAPEQPRFVSFASNQRLVELLANETNAVALFRTDGLRATDTSSAPFACWDLIRHQRVDWASELFIPFQGELQNGCLSFRWVSTLADFQKVLLHDLRTSESSGTLYFGCSNDQGRVAWAQIDYLNAMLDLVVYSSLLPSTRFLDPEFRSQLRLRLDLEVLVLDQLLAPDAPGLVSRRYTLGRETPATFAGHSGLVLRFLNRYQALLPDPVPLSNFASFSSAVFDVAGQIETLQFTGAETAWAAPGFAFLQYPYGAPVTFDGIPGPYNLQNAWAEGVLTTAHAPVEKKATAIQVISLFNESELTNKPAGDYAWPYWYGPAREGWDANSTTSLNTPDYPGHKGLAGISYKTLDACAVMAMAANAEPGLIASETLDYLGSALSAGELNLCTMENFIRLSRIPEVSPRVLLRDSRVDGAYTFPNTAWSYLLLTDSGAVGADDDHDGFENSAEVMAATDPEDPASNPRLALTHEGEVLTATWNGQPGIRYQLQRTESLDQVWVLAHSIDVTAAQQITWITNLNSRRHEFFKLRIARQLVAE